ncbi:Gtr1/RagA domain containing G protein [Nitzschia inconspicua]|uniref:Gtr1/RagA domain containing G protein n=1 Tax=Nitzschia inconspicua TaxID=303405 RepID=A0A9K3KUQ5_9STRA|nr:Gtr1/RagA domain containing G protein [Nitzschia inconspicua]
MMESNDYSHYEDSYNEYLGGHHHHHHNHHDEGHYPTEGGDDDGMRLLMGSTQQHSDDNVANTNGNFDDDPRILSLPRILLMGPRRGGKTSIQKVVFHKMSPHETLFRLEATQNLDRAVVDHTALCRFTVWDFPGDYFGEGEDENVFQGATSLIFVVDAQDEPYDHVLQCFTNAVTRALEQNPNIVIEVFINKVDGELFLSDESKYDCRRDIMTQVTDELNDAGVSPDSIHIRYHLTSIYDHSIYEALSRVVQRLIPQLPTLENLLNVLVSTCSMEKAYLFDVVSKLYISTDPGPVDMQSVELCSDMIDVVLDVSGIYGLGPSHLELGNTGGEITTSINNNNNTAMDSNAVTNTNKNPAESSTPQQSLRKEGGDNTSVAAAAAAATSSTDELVGTLISQVPVEDLEEEMVDPDSAYDSESASVIRLSNGMVLYLKEVDTMLALVCITRAENFRKRSLINYNIGCLKKALRALVQTPSAPSTENGH